MTVDLDDIDFEHLIGSRNIDVCKLISEIDERGITWALCYYARDIIQGRWIEAEPFIKKDPEAACHYALHVIKGRWAEAEPYIMKDPKWAYYYTINLIKGRWPEAEPYMMKDSESACCYAIFIIKERWPEAEHYIQGNQLWAFHYFIRFGVKL